ncbi:MAG: four helix bundle protein [Chloroflexi bacterium]|nr:four helix bundle protein [Chloroflexota bacterium]
MATIAAASSLKCARCGASLAVSRYEVRAGEAKLRRCLRCALIHRPMLARSLVICLVVGTILTAINQGNVILAGDFPSALAWKIPLTYSVPFCVATLGALLNARSAVSSQQSAVSSQRGRLRAKLRDFRELKVWEKAHHLALEVYKATATFPKDELYGLTSQIRRCCASIPANIAEGCGRSGDAELARFLQIAMGSASELEYHLLLSHDLDFLNGSDYERLSGDVTEVKRMHSEAEG